MKKFLKGFHYAAQGIGAAFSSEINFRAQSMIAVLAIVLGVILGISMMEWCLITMMICWVLMAELFNTALEVITDHVSPGKHPSAKLVKDLSAGAVMVSALGAAIVGLIIFIPYFI